MQFEQAKFQMRLVKRLPLHRVRDIAIEAAHLMRLISTKKIRLMKYIAYMDALCFRIIIL